MKAFTRVLIALFGAFFVSLYAQVSVCRPGILEQPSNQWLCGHRLLPTWLLLIPVFFIALMLLLGKHCVAYRRTMSVLLLSTYGIYAAFESVNLHAWWQVSFSVAMLLAAVGIALRKRWGSVLVCALSLLFGVYYIWSVGVAVHSGYLKTVRPLEAALSFVPGIAFGLLAGFCCYVAIRQRRSEPGRV
jgi:hypothetical protein